MTHSIKKQSMGKKIVTYFFLLLGVLFAAFPIVWLISMSIRPNGEVFATPPSIIPKVFTLGAYAKIFASPEKIRFFINSYVVALIVTACTLFIAMLTAYSFSRFTFKGKKVINMLIIGTQTVPPISLMIPYFGMMVTYKLYDTYFALIFTYLALTLPYAILMMTGFFNTLPKALDEAVLIDGGSRLLTLFRVIVPISLPGIVSTGLYTFLLSWNEFLFALTLTKSNEMATVPIGIQLLMGQHTYEWNEMMAMSFLGSLPIMILFLFFQRYFLAGMSAGSVKS
ncbi:carbohydrate ABC transporter permease [Sediminispirochaeta smaragdinae]|uniref:Binding-protein-dependent transport systems inner membrane component n=1 Tax=Sediminispirochaeta smaragdinae (strain DSM 11293 / JCM 15392 / SEBR 4228) TaxID=573413 RepID=E1R2C4_SEDSS|nr:carbohydrate ABC transporter permease [Sediminispirochaeta smaragdinae]ADK82484.1 binding-protein-dependent transport systems inner membrane component [Sediminispirochaeta smaragdinae DSM 11293]